MKRGEDVHGKGASLGPAQNWVRAAEAAVLDLLDHELAVVHPEIEARLSEQGIPQDSGRRLHLDPHILSEAVRTLKDLSAFEEQVHRTKGSRAIRVIVLADRTGRTTATTQAVRRKGMLYGRFRALADTAGEAGEAVVRHSLAQAGPHLIPMEPKFVEVRRLLTVPMAGPLDSGAWLHPIDPGTGRPITHALPIEVKNRRQVLYPIHKEVHQLLAKAAGLQVANPEYPITPVLICRRAHPRLFWMARDLTLIPRTGPLPTIRQFFEQTLPTASPHAAPRWAIVAEVIQPYFDALREDDLDSAERQEIVANCARPRRSRSTTVGSTMISSPGHFPIWMTSNCAAPAAIRLITDSAWNGRV